MSATCKRAALALFSTLILASTASAIVLWDQSTIAPAGPGIANSNSPGFGGFIIHSVNDVTVPATGWHMTSITSWYSYFNPSWTGITQGFLYVQPKTGALPTLPPAAAQVPMSAALDAAKSAELGQSVLAVTCNVNMNLAPGDYWIGITPTASAGISGANQQWPAVAVGVPVASYSAPGPWANFYQSWDGAFIVNGDATVAVNETMWGSIKSLYQ